MGAQPLVLAQGDRERTLYLTPDGIHGGPDLTLDAVHDDGTLIATLDGVRRRYHWLYRDGRVWLQDGGLRACFEERTHRASGGEQGPGSGQLKAPMDGAVIEVSAAAGDTVKRGQTLAVLEAMKMEHALKADCDGTVDTVTVSAGDQVKRQQLLITVTPEVVTE